MALYNHAAVWDDKPELWPRGYYTNGHVQVDAEKMSKSKGNFLMMNETVQKYSCDGTRLACADAGDSLEDANFSREVADNSILTLFIELNWFKETIAASAGGSLRDDAADTVFMDKVFDNEINRLSRICDDSYANMKFRDGLKAGFYDMIGARDLYRDWCLHSGIPMKKSLANKWMNHLALLMTPITPHWSETVWALLGNTTFIVKEKYPDFAAEDKVLSRKTKFLMSTLKSARQTVSKAKAKPTEAWFVVVDEYSQWRKEALIWMHGQHSDGAFTSTFMADLKKWVGTLEDKKNVKNVMQFASFVKKEVEDVGESAMELTMPYDQKEILSESKKYIQAQLNLEKFDIVKIGIDELPPGLNEKGLMNCQPGKPLLFSAGGAKGGKK